MSAILLMGLRGSGKTTVGPILAASLALPFHDLDPLTAAHLHQPSAAEAFNLLGEPSFRTAEVAALANLLTGPPTIIGLGGGTPTAPGFAAALAVATTPPTLIYLRASAATLRTRLSATNTAARPSLTSKGTLTEIEEVLAQRDPLYHTLAHHEIAVDDRSPAQVAATLTSWWRSHRQTS